MNSNKQNQSPEQPLNHPMGPASTAGVEARDLA
jgi:hypothetical protein